MKRTTIFYFVIILLLTPFIIAQSERPMTPEDLYKIKNVSGPQVSPDGEWIAYTISVPSLEENRYNSDIWLIPVSGGEPKQLTNSPESDHSPRWSPDAKQIAFISDRDSIDNLYLISVSGGEAYQLTASETKLYNPIWSKDGKNIICGSRVLPEGKKDTENWTENELPECKARTINNLL